MFRRIILIIFLCMAILTGLVVHFFKGHYAPPILMYHYSKLPAATKDDPLAVSPQVFERQMRFLKDNRYNVLTLEALAGLIKEKKKAPARTVVITFDDGYIDNFQYAFPVLKKYGLPATIFLVVNEVGKHYRLTWDQIKIMQDSGLITFGSHALGPEPLINIKSEEALRKEIFDSKALLEQKLGRDVLTFSYPEGMFNAKIRQLVIEAGYKAAVATTAGLTYPNNDIFVLKRLRISENSANMFIFAVETSGYYTFMKEYKKFKKEQRKAKYGEK